MFDDGQVQNRLVQTEHCFDVFQLERAAQVLNERFAGQLLPAIQESLASDLLAAKAAL